MSHKPKLHDLKYIEIYWLKIVLNLVLHLIGKLSSQLNLLSLLFASVTPELGLLVACVLVLMATGSEELYWMVSSFVSYFITVVGFDFEPLGLVNFLWVMRWADTSISMLLQQVLWFDCQMFFIYYDFHLTQVRLSWLLSLLGF